MYDLIIYKYSIYLHVFLSFYDRYTGSNTETPRRGGGIDLLQMFTKGSLNLDKGNSCIYAFCIYCLVRNRKFQFCEFYIFSHPVNSKFMICHKIEKFE